MHVGDYSRGGRSRGIKAVKALDHDMCMKEKLVPGGILEPVSGKSFLFFGTNYKTSDFMADGLLLWWQHGRPELCGLKQLVINLDNGPECNGRRSQFLLRMTEFADMTGLCVRVIYYPPYHSKYNAIERYGGTGEIMERLSAEYRGYGNPSSREFLLERDAHSRKLGGLCLREGCQNLRQREKKPRTPTGAIH